MKYFYSICLLLCFQYGLAQYFGRMASPAGCAPGAAIATGGFGNPGLFSPYGSNSGYGFGYGAQYGYGYGAAEYGGVGDGNVDVTGELPVAGTTAVAGQVPILGAVRFAGDVTAGGAITIAGNCACGCSPLYGLGYFN